MQYKGGEGDGREHHICGRKTFRNREKWNALLVEIITVNNGLNVESGCMTTTTKILNREIRTEEST